MWPKTNELGNGSIEICVAGRAADGLDHGRRVQHLLASLAGAGFSGLPVSCPKEIVTDVRAARLWEKP
jgi:hypothetical protein